MKRKFKKYFTKFLSIFIYLILTFKKISFESIAFILKKEISYLLIYGILKDIDNINKFKSLIYGIIIALVFSETHSEKISEINFGAIGKLNGCTAFVIKSQKINEENSYINFILTAGHCLNKEKNLSQFEIFFEDRFLPYLEDTVIFENNPFYIVENNEIKFIDRKKWEAFVLGYSNYKYGDDFAILYFYSDIPFPVLDLELFNEPKKGDTVVIIGFPKGEFRKTTGIFLKEKDIYYVFEGYVTFGNSGSPVFNKDNKVIGIVVAYDYINNKRVILATKIKFLKDLIRGFF